jgi:hypothetical protein
MPPLWSSTDSENPGVVAEADYIEPGYFRVTVRKGNHILTDTVTAQYPPVFGIDVADMTQIQGLAGALSDRLKALEAIGTTHPNEENPDA